MKKLLMLLLMLSISRVWAQNFEGTIKWSMKMEVTDPELKAKMAQGQAQMNDPATQAKMKQLQEQMKDPKMKAMMEANPQMKAMMEKMSQGGGGDMMNNMVPKGMTLRMKDGNSLVTMEGGMMAGDILNTADKSVKLNRDEKTYWVMPTGGNKMQSEGVKPTITKTTETTKILGYNCTKYVVTMAEHGQTLTSNIWTTTEISGVDMKAMAKQKMGRGQSIFYEGMDGVPLRIESKTPQGQMTMEVTEFKRESLDASLFTIPSDYKETQGMFGGGGGMR